jgi:hypothetical protein
MPFGSGIVARHALARATGWQRAALAVGLIVVGGLLIALGHVAGALLGLSGVVVLTRTVRDAVRRRRAVSRGTGPDNPTAA